VYVAVGWAIVAAVVAEGEEAARPPPHAAMTAAARRMGAPREITTRGRAAACGAS
jgi:hypothetical protein